MGCICPVGNCPVVYKVDNKMEYFQAANFLTHKLRNLKWIYCRIYERDVNYCVLSI